MEMIKIWTSSQYLVIESAQNILGELGIESHIMDKRDSTYPGIIGSVDLYVKEDVAEKAKETLNKQLAE